MKNMTYRDLLNILLKATNDELAQNVTVCLEAFFGHVEIFPVSSAEVSGERKDCPADGILDEGHLYLEVK